VLFHPTYLTRKIEHFLKVNLKKIRMGMPTFVDRPDSDDDENQKLPADVDQDEDKTQR